MVVVVKGNTVWNFKLDYIFRACDSGFGGHDHVWSVQTLHCQGVYMRLLQRGTEEADGSLRQGSAWLWSRFRPRSKQPLKASTTVTLHPKA